MDSLDLFFKKYSYKFPKGYPDLNDEQDINLLADLLEGLEINLNEKELTWRDLGSESRKYSRLSFIANKIKNEEAFDLEDGTKDILTFAKDSYYDLFANQKVDDIKKIGGSSINKFPFFKNSDGKDISFSNISKTSELGGIGSKASTSERQERGLIELINSVSGIKNLIGDNGVKINNIIEAYKVPNPGKYEAYADVGLKIKDDKDYLLSAKGTSTPSIAGGGLDGITKINEEVSNFVKKFYEDAYQYYKNIFDKNENIDYNTNLYKTDYFKDVNRLVPENIILNILKGTEEMGGPVDGYYMGPMDVKSTVEDNNIKINGDIINVEDFAKKYKQIYMFIKKRDGDYYFTDDTQTINGITMPLIFTNKPGGKAARSRFGMNIKPRNNIII